MKKEGNKEGAVTFFDYVVRPWDGALRKPGDSINTKDNYPKKSKSDHRFAVGTYDQNFIENKYYTWLGGKEINKYDAGTGDNAKKTGIIKGLSDDYKNVIFDVDEPGVFSLDAKKGKTVLNGYELSFTQKGDTYKLNSVYDPKGGKVADAGNSFFPLDNAASRVHNDKGDNDNHNYYFGMRYDVEFTIGDYVGDMTYKFTGDDDLWVLIDGQDRIRSWRYSSGHYMEK